MGAPQAADDIVGPRVAGAGENGNRMAGKPQVTIVPDYEAMSRIAADLVAETVTRSPGTAISVPTGSTPLGLFEELIVRVRRGELDLSQAHIFCLDEYLGVTAEDPNSLTGWLNRSFLTPACIPRAHVHTLPAADPDPDAAAKRYEAEIAAVGGLALAVLGLGGNGHIAYNEPGSAGDSRTRVLTLTPESIEQAAGYWEETVPIPKQAMTVGVGTLLEARQIVLIVSGTAKADVLERTLRGPMTEEIPASWLQWAGDRLTVIADEDAASRLG